MSDSIFCFGKEEAEKYGDLIVSKLKGKTISKRKNLANEEGGLIYEAKQLNIDHFDLLRALCGMLYDGRVVELDDSTYLVR